jgi:hypothetical protein
MQMEQIEVRRPAAAFASSCATRGASGGVRSTRAGGCRARRARRRHTGRARDTRATGLSAAALERLEESLLNNLLNVHPNRRRALGRLLDDVDRAEGAPLGLSLAGRRAQTVSAARSTASRLRIEELLVAVVIGAHPHRRASLDRLLDDLAGRDTELRARDNDFDGLG